MMSTGRNRLPFTASQWQELEHQALIFKHMISGTAIPPDLLFAIKRSLDSSLSSNLILHQPHQMGWNCFQMGFGKKIDPEPGRCRRTDGKKWRCSKEAYADSKYCERHMHRGRNRSRKPVEIMTTSTTATTAATNISTTPTIPRNPNPSNFTQYNPTSHSMSSIPNDYNTPLHHPFLYPHSSSSRPPPGTGLSFQDSSTHFLLESHPYSHTDKDYRYSYGHGMKEEVDEHAFFSETSGTMRCMSGSSADDSWHLEPLTMGGSSSLAHSKQRTLSDLHTGFSYSDSSKQQNQDQHYYVLGNNEMNLTIERDDQPQKVMHHFFDEGPPKNKDSWSDSEDKLSNSTTQLSISMLKSSHDFFMTHNDK